MASVPAFSAGPDHLVLTEVSIRGGLYTNAYTSSEYVEVYNPTASPVSDIQNYYVTDWTSYHTLPTVVRDNALPNLGGGDFLLKFPATAAPIQSGSAAVVTANGTTFLQAFFGGSLAAFQAQPGSPQLFEVYDSDPAIPNMDNLNQEATDNKYNLSHTDAGENQFLVYWDGASDVVKDVDMFMYAAVAVNLGTGNGIINKTGLSADGPDGDTTPSPYLNDGGSTANLTARYANRAGTIDPFQYYRRSLIEVGESASGGNGITGHDETLEEINVTWGGAYETTATATPGIVPFGLSSANQPPVIYAATVAQPFPQAGQSVQFQARVQDDGSVASAVLKVDTGSGYTDVPMTNNAGLWTATITAPANGTIVKWYVSATDNGGLTSTSNQFQYSDSTFPGYFSLAVGFDSTKIQFTEIHFDPVGSDNAGESEFVEVHNFSAGPIDLSGFLFSRVTPDDATFSVITPPGTIIPAGDYLIYASSKPLFLLSYPGFDANKVVDLNWRRSSTLANGADTVYLTHPTQITPGGEPSIPFESFAYSGMVAGSGAGNTGFTFELSDVDGPNENQAAWAVSLIPGGSPGRRSTMDNPTNIAIANQGRTIQYPTSSTPIVINADVTASAAISSVQLFYTTSLGASYTATPMTLASGSQYTKDLGTFADNTLVKYYIQATDANGNTRVYPPNGIPVAFFVEDQPITEADLLFNEMMSDPTDVENEAFSEWLEIRNQRSEPINMSFFKVGHTLAAGPYPRVLPEGTIIPAKGYLVFAGNKPVFQAQYPTVDPATVVDALYVASIIANASGVAFITHANAINWNELTWQNPGLTFESVAYFDATNGWPNTTNNISRELLDPTADNNVGTNWALSTVPGGTPGATNSTSAVSDWSVY